MKIKQETPIWEPKYANRHKVTFTSGLEINSYVINSTDRLIWENGEFKTVQMNLYDPICPSSAQCVMQCIKLNEDKDAIPCSYKLEILDKIGEIVEVWEIAGEIKKIDFGKVSWDTESAKPINIKLFIKPISAKLIY